VPELLLWGYIYIPLNEATLMYCTAQPAQVHIPTLYMSYVCTWPPP
jgi:hypothetical protein